jgi:iron complex outermembrane recepter protein
MKGRIDMKSIFKVSLCSLALAGVSGTALAQSAPAEDNGGLEEIVVTATKRSENLQDVPVAVSAISATALQNAGVFETSDLNHSMPNLQVSSPYGEAQPNFSLRGVGVGTEFNANAASPVGVYVDEVYQAFRASHGQQLYDLNQIEVVRGPQGTLFGRNTTGGAINFITRAPELKGNNGYLTLGYGNYNRFNAQGAIEYTGSEDKFGVRVAGTYVNSDPYVRNRLAAGVNRSAAGGASGLNLSTGKDYGGYESYGVRGTLRFKPAEGVDFSLKGYTARSKGGTEGPLPTGQSKTSDVINWRSPNFLLNGIFNALAPAGLLPSTYSASANGLNDREVQADTVGDAITEANGVVFNAKIELTDNLNLTSISGYDDGRYLQSPTDCDGTPLRLCAIHYNSKFNAFNQDLRLDYSKGPVKLIVGGYYGKDSVTAANRPDFFNFLRDVNAAVGSPSGYFNPGGAFNGTALSATSLPTGVTAIQRFKQVRKSYAFYGEGSYQITDTVKLTAGLRYTSDKNIFKDGNTTYFDDLGVARLITVSNFKQGGAFAPYFLQAVRDEAGAVVIPSFQGLGIPLPGPLEQKGSSNKLSGRVILDWKPTDTSMIYASYSRGYRAGTFNGLAYGSANQVYFVAPEQVNAYEIGFKSRFADNRIQINGSFFYYDYKGQQGQVVDASATANLISLNGTLKGLELDAQFIATDTLRFSASFGLLDTKYAKGACPANPATIPNFPAQLGSCVVSGGGPVSVEGNPFPYAAKSTGNVAFDWDVVEVGSGKVTLHGDAAYTGRFYYDSFKDYSRGPLVNLSTGKFSQGEGNDWTLNSRLTYGSDRFSVSAWVKNITDKTTYPFGIAIENLFGNGYRPRAQPRTFGIEGTVKF